MFWKRFTDSGCMNASAAVVGIAAYTMHLRQPPQYQNDRTQSILAFSSAINFMVAIALRIK